MSAPENTPTRPCRKCGKELVFAEVKKKDGTPGQMPLDVSAPVYLLTPGPKPFGIRALDSFVTHFATCSSASDFTKKDGVSAADEADALRSELADTKGRLAMAHKKIRELIADRDAKP